jgi:tetratricopeptide (TPR) repeat protein
MLWLYGVAWHQPMAQAIAWARTSVTDVLPSAHSLFPGGFGGTTAAAGVSGGIKQPVLVAAPAQDATAMAAPSDPSAPIDVDLAARFAERHARAAVLKIEGPRMLQAGNWRRAAELCRTWTDLELGNSDAWRCLGLALQAQGYHQDAIEAFRKAKQYDPGDRSIDAAIDRSQKGIVADFLSRNRR